jgi:hypothetical protein
MVVHVKTFNFGGNTNAPRNKKGVNQPIHNKKRLKSVRANLRVENDTNILSSQESPDEDQEPRKTLELGKQLGLYAEIEDKVIQNLTKLRRSSRKRSTPRRFK